MRIFITHKWRTPKVMIALMILELPFTIAFLTLAGIADDDLYRTKLWQNGSDLGFNSNPNEILYAYANYSPIPTPVVWSSYLTEFNIVISVLSMFILLVKSAMYTMHGFLPVVSALVHAAEVALYAVSVRNQTHPDLSDMEHPVYGLPWYLTKGCSFATSANYGYCMQARATFAIVVVMLALFIAYLGVSIWSCFPTELERAQRQAEREADLEMKQMEIYEDEEISREEEWMRGQNIILNLPKTPKSPGFNLMTPRTKAFTALNGGPMPKTPARVEIVPTSSSSKRRPKLSFKERFGPRNRLDG